MKTSELTEGFYVVYFSAYKAPHLTIHTENVSFVYNVNSGEWLQTLPLKKVRGKGIGGLGVYRRELNW